MGGGGRHLSLTLKQHDVVLRAVAFGKGDWADELEASTGDLAICFAPSINRYRGFESVQLQLKDWQLMSEADVSSGHSTRPQPTQA